MKGCQICTKKIVRNRCASVSLYLTTFLRIWHKMKIEAARISLAKSRQVRRRRIMKEYDINGVVALTDAGSERKGESARHVYDCKGGTKLRQE